MERRLKSVLVLHRAVCCQRKRMCIWFDLHPGLRCLFIRGIPARLIKISANQSNGLTEEPLVRKKDAINLFLIAKITANSPVVLIG